MEQHELRPPRGAKRPRKRIGRGNASGHGTYSGRGIKGQQSRSGSGPSHAFEGGQTPLVRRLPRRRGFTNPFRVAYTPVNLHDLAKFPDGGEVTPESLHAMGVAPLRARSVLRPDRCRRGSTLGAPRANGRRRAGRKADRACQRGRPDAP
ncbi:MAG: 50S ribosomal protein L15, partial [Chloroflexi bacterium]|nr:50S ribosomal protein L15 [Chloroflexota bacterium]